MSEWRRACVTAAAVGAVTGAALFALLMRHRQPTLSRSRREANFDDVELQLREQQLSRTTLLLGAEKLQTLMHAHVVVLGTAGSGSHAAMHIARSGVGNITLLDCVHLTSEHVACHSSMRAVDAGRPAAATLGQLLSDIIPFNMDACDVDGGDLRARAVALRQQLLQVKSPTAVVVALSASLPLRSYWAVVLLLCEAALSTGAALFVVPHDEPLVDADLDTAALDDRIVLDTVAASRVDQHILGSAPIEVWRRALLRAVLSSSEPAPVVTLFTRTPSPFTTVSRVCNVKTLLSTQLGVAAAAHVIANLTGDEKSEDDDERSPLRTAHTHRVRTAERKAVAAAFTNLPFWEAMYYWRHVWCTECVVCGQHIKLPKAAAFGGVPALVAVPGSGHTFYVLVDAEHTHELHTALTSSSRAGALWERIEQRRCVERQVQRVRAEAECLLR